MLIPFILKLSAPSSSTPFYKLVVAETLTETATVVSTNFVLTTTSIIEGTPPNTSYITSYTYQDGVNGMWYTVRWVDNTNQYTAWSNRVKLIDSTLRYRIARKLKDLATNIGDSDWDDIINAAEADVLERESEFDNLSSWHKAWMVRRGYRHALEEISSVWVTSFNIRSGSKGLDLGSPIYQIQRALEMLDKAWDQEITKEYIYLSGGHWVVGSESIESYSLLWPDEFDDMGVDWGVHRRQDYYNQDTITIEYPDQDDIPT